MRRRDFLASIGAAAGCAASEKPRGIVIDAHCHAGKGMNFGKPGELSPPWTTFNDPEVTLRRMEEAGISKTVIFPISNVEYADANREIAGYVRRWPDKFIGFAKHDQKSEAGRIRDLLTREVKELGLKGLKLHGAPTREMMEVVSELRIPVLCHPAAVADLAQAAQEWPGVDFLLAHLGSFASARWREHIAAIEAAKRLPNLFLETSSVVFQGYLEQAARELGPQKLVFGTDGPLVDSRVELHKIRLLKLPPESELQVLSGNISRILRM